MQNERMLFRNFSRSGDTRSVRIATLLSQTGCVKRYLDFWNNSYYSAIKNLIAFGYIYQRITIMDKIIPDTYDKFIKGLMDISRAITSDLYIEDILKLIVMVTAKVTGVEICSLWLIDESESPKKIRLKATQTIDPDYVQDRSLGMDEGVVGFVASHKQPLMVENVLEEPRFKEKEMANKLGLGWMLSVPLRGKDGRGIG